MIAKRQKYISKGHFINNYKNFISATWNYFIQNIIKFKSQSSMFMLQITNKTLYLLILRQIFYSHDFLVPPTKLF